MRSSNKPIKLAILYRVLQHWRAPIFKRLSEYEDIDLKVFHGGDFHNTKVVNATGAMGFESKKMATIPIRLQTSNSLAVAPFCPGLLIDLIRFRPDVILCEGASNLPNNIIAYFYAKLFGAKIIQWSLGEIKNWKKSRLRRSLDWAIEWMETHSDAILAYSSRGQEYYRKLGVPEQDIFVAVNVVDTAKKIIDMKEYDAEILKESAHQDVDFIVLFVGALDIPKKVDLLLYAFAEFSNQSSLRVHLNIVGEGSDRVRLESIASDLGIKNVSFKGKVIKEISKYFLESDVFVLPGMGGLAVSDSLVHGLPIIATIGDGCEGDLLAFGGGILDENLSSESLTKYLHELSLNQGKLNEMALNAVATISDHHNIESYMHNLHSSIKYAAGRK